MEVEAEVSPLLRELWAAAVDGARGHIQMVLVARWLPRLPPIGFNTTAQSDAHPPLSTRRETGGSTWPSLLVWSMMPYDTVLNHLSPFYRRKFRLWPILS